MADDPLSLMDELLDRLVRNAEELQRLATGTVETGALHKLQSEQEVMLAELVKIDRQVDQTPSGKADPMWKGIETKLETFSQLNDSFIDALSIRKGLIQFEIQDVKKTRQSLVEMKVRYGNQSGDRKRVDETS